MNATLGIFVPFTKVTDLWKSEVESRSTKKAGHPKCVFLIYLLYFTSENITFGKYIIYIFFLLYFTGSQMGKQTRFRYYGISEK